MSAFLPPSDFAGDDSHRPVSAKSPVGQGRAIFNGEIVFSNVARADADTLLARSKPLLASSKLELAANIGAQPGVHPVIHLHGKQTQTSWIIDEQSVQIGSDYGECMLLLPFVHIEGSPQFHTFVVRMYLEDPGAVALGVHFGYRKRLAQVSFNAQTCTVRRMISPFFSTLVFTSDHRPSLSPTASLMPNWADMKAIMSMPILGVDEFTGQQFCSYFRLDDSSASIHPIDCSHDYLQGFEPAIPMAGTVTSVIDGAVSITNLDWRIDFPALQC